ncbi:MAG TPA: hypothetical protein V6C95_20140, partial [Coleofasciculaceae cyanobacterium]
SLSLSLLAKLLFRQTLTKSKSSFSLWKTLEMLIRYELSNLQGFRPRFDLPNFRVDSSLLGGEIGNHRSSRPASFCWERAQRPGGQLPEPESKTIFQ